MVSGGARPPAWLRGRPEPRDHVQKAGGAAPRVARPLAAAQELERAGGARAGSPARGGGLAAAQVRSRLSPTWRGGGGSPEAAGHPGRAAGRRAVLGAVLGSREGGSGRPQKPFRFVQVT